MKNIRYFINNRTSLFSVSPESETETPGMSPATEDSQVKNENPKKKGKSNKTNKFANQRPVPVIEYVPSEANESRRMYNDYFSQFFMNYMGEVSSIAYPQRIQYAEGTLKFTVFVDVLRLKQQAATFADALYMAGISYKALVDAKDGIEARRIYADMFIYSFFKSYLYGYKISGNTQIDLIGHAFYGHVELYSMLKCRDVPDSIGDSPNLLKVFEVDKLVHIYNIDSLITNSFVAGMLYLRYLNDKPLIIPFFENIFERILPLYKNHSKLSDIIFKDNFTQDEATTSRSKDWPTGAFLYNNVKHPGDYNRYIAIPGFNTLATDSFLLGKALFLNFVSYEDNRGNEGAEYSGVPPFMFERNEGNKTPRTDLLIQSETYFVSGISRAGERQSNPAELVRVNAVTKPELNAKDEEFLVPENYKAMDYYGAYKKIAVDIKTNNYVGDVKLSKFITTLDTVTEITDLPEATALTLTGADLEAIL